MSFASEPILKYRDNQAKTQTHNSWEKNARRFFANAALLNIVCLQ